VEIKYSFDGENYALLRLAHLTLVDMVSIGPMCAAPEGNGFTVTFEQFSIRPT
jgi:regulation of enolase protein 1 (concanavalin A-like superfamily)